jgi:molybdopterin/thiamine biosynthesis adenylyltransferase
MVPIDRIWSVGRTIKWLSPITLTAPTRLDDRQRDALGRLHDYMRALDVAVVGCGGLGSPTAEQVVRIGARSILLNDLDRVDTPSNVRRMFGATNADAEAAVAPAKVDVVGRHLQQLGLDTQIRRIDGDVRTERVFRQLLDADVVICATDTHGSRAVLNDLASAYLMPVIDVGVRVGARNNGVLSGLVAEVRVLTSATPCLWCRKTISADAIRIENLPPEERERLRREGYAVGSTAEPAPSVVSLTVLGSGLATCALIALFAEDADVAPSAYWVDGLFGDAAEPFPSTPSPDCWCRSRIALGDAAAPPFID